VLILADLVLTNRDLARKQFRIVSKKTWGYEDALEPSIENKAPVAIWSQNMHMLIDSLPLCDFAFPQVVRPFKDRQDWLESEDISGDLEIDLRLLRAVTGVNYVDLSDVSERFLSERLMLARFIRAMRDPGVTSSAFAGRMVAVDPKGFTRLLDEYYQARGWDLQYGWPQIEQLKKLGLEDAALELEKIREEFT
jgi:aldehyde:ferredoxin oxidoreductase